MTGRAASEDDEQQDRGRGSARLMLVAAMALALGAAAVLVLSDNARWLRLAVVAALWAALVGAFLAARYRRQVADREDEVADLQSVYELELEREVAARREYELEIESETRKRVQDEARDDLEALRGELRALRENLEALLGGEVLVERVALRAESTRMRSLSDQSRLMSLGDKRIIAGSSAPVTKKVAEKPQPDRTELIERLGHDNARKEQVRRPEPTRPEPARREPAQPARREPARATAQQRPVPPVVRREAPKVEPTERVNGAARQAPASRPAEPVEARPADRGREPVNGDQGVQRRGRVAERTEMISRDALSQSAPQASADAARRVVDPAPVRRSPAERASGRSAVEATGEQRPAPGELRRPSTARAELTGEHRPVGGGRPDLTGEHRPVVGGRPDVAGEHRPVVGGRADPTGEHRPAGGGRPDLTGEHRPVVGGRPDVTGEHRPVAGGRPDAAGGHRPVAGGRADVTGEHRPVVGGRPDVTGEHRPVEARRAPVGDDVRRRGAADPSTGHGAVAPESVGGRSADSVSAAVTSGEGRRRAPDAVETGGRRRAEEAPGLRGAPEPAEPAGAHADGKSVSELLAAFGGADSPRRRRRRED